MKKISKITEYSITEAYFYIKNNLNIKIEEICAKYNVNEYDARVIKRIAKEVNLNQFEIKQSLVLIDLGYQTEAYFTEQESIEGYIPCSYEELIKEYNEQ